MKKKKVMVVDDELDLLKMLKLNLENTDKYEVQTMSDAGNIIALVKLFQPDIILMDILMPKVNGAQACKMLKDDPEVRHIPIITLTALDTEKDKIIMFGLGVADFLTKPIGHDELITKIEKVLKDK